ncbi:MAG: hypothetical protein HOV81_16855 [Kofleriaceae bacterium]|nr:hypothetical protein [Kofleriaceae bacterium]
MPSVEMLNARTTARDPAAAAEDICNQFGSVKPKFVSLFASRDRDQRALNAALRERLPKDTRLFGATTGGEIDRDGMHSGSVVAAGLYGDFDVAIGLGREISRDAVAAGEAAIKSAAQQLGARADDLGTKNYVAMVVDDAFQFRKEELLLGVMSMNQALVAVGGGASDTEFDPAKWSSEIHVDGEVTSNSVAVVLFRTRAPWAAMRSHWYVPTGQTIRLTKIDESAQRVLEIDGKPAAQRYAELLGVGIDELEFGKPKGFAANPVALRVGREYFIRAPWKPLPDGSILFANMLEQGSELELVKATSAGESTRRFFQTELPARVPNPRATLIFNCAGRTVHAAATGQAQELSDAFKVAPPCAGFNVQFEIYCGFQINSTLTALSFGASS